MNHAPLTTAVFDDLIRALTEIRDGYVLDIARFDDPLETAEAFRYVAQCLSAASELFVESDPDHPRFASIVSPARKLQGDNPDAIYHWARIRGDRSYVVTGRVDRQCYVSFTLHGRAADGGMAGPVLGDVNHRQFHVEPDGTYRLVLSPDEHEGNWVRLDPDVYCVIVRSYFDLEPSGQNDSSVSVDIDIRPLDDSVPPPLSDEALADRFAQAVAFLRQVTVGQGVFAQPRVSVPFVSDVPNTLPVPFSFRDSGLPVPGAVDLAYAMGRFALEPDQALVMTGVLPPCVFANVMLWNSQMQTLEYRYRTSSLNRSQIVPEADGTFRIVIAHEDPGVANWLDCEGHRRGSIFWRFVLPEAPPAPITCEVVPLASLRT